MRRRFVWRSGWRGSGDGRQQGRAAALSSNQLSGGFEIFLEPDPGQFRDFVECAGLFKEMAGAGNDFETVRGIVRQGGNRGAVEAENYRIVVTDDEEGRRVDSRERGAGKIRPAASRDDCMYYPGVIGCCCECRGGTRARPEIAEAEAVETILCADPVGYGGEAGDQEFDIEAQSPGSGVYAFLVFCQEIGEDSRDGAAVQRAGHAAVSGAVAAAAAAVGEENKTGGVFGKRKIGGERRAAGGYAYLFVCNV